MDIRVNFCPGNFCPCTLQSFLRGQPVGLVPELEALGGAVLLWSLTHGDTPSLGWKWFHPTGFLESSSNADALGC